ncbi:MAG: peptidoglycan-associated lipoprotein [Henriciella sp.]|jgi:peptidoglycan-associated lipoprotein|uniref:peptidoglycan-associated lipoprotein Pal n=1 Tax=Henriciella sp. TaxID=1968823 RepID=UPI000C1000D4|nr:peptidoglycan-associated lipoprotein Pal [Henriciella sp.]MAN72564.1 peptidoglycan-associated lipoprotein [Henriciella sp.]MBF33102.1 peptidoglycan-associated lipoprotein [Hyphomonadaceae bacterium]MBK74916.1 peptidoglycan-associated lipoprotein [Henriciella sp.]PHR82990.1 MAG: peptidoglycan-associated lipoprotein [Henriciella sp.]|tara:strand:- start:501 stop:1058 length:558 start_codon:yes stop_codon:yes gene_type:complete
MRRLVISTASIALVLGAAACASKPDPVDNSASQVSDTDSAPTGPVNESDIEQPSRVIDSGPTAGSLEDFKVNVGDRVYFDLDQYRLDGDDQSVLQRQAAWLQQYPNVRILVAGNADERGTREYNLALGERRASVVRDYLVNLGVSPSRIDTVSYGKERPIAAESNEAAWAMNRNAFTQIMGGPSS